MRNIFLNLIFVTLFSSCNFLLGRIHHERNPKVESAASIERWVRLRGFHDVSIATVHPDLYYLFHRFRNQQFVFSNNGRFLAAGFHQGVKCVIPHQAIRLLKPAGQMAILPDSFIVDISINAGRIQNPDQLSRREAVREARKLVASMTKNNIVIDTLYPDLQFILGGLRGLNGEAFALESQSGYDYILLLPFARFLGKTFQVDELRKKYSAATGNRHARIKVVMVNIDKQHWWDERYKRKI